MSGPRNGIEALRTRIGGDLTPAAASPRGCAAAAGSPVSPMWPPFRCRSGGGRGAHPGEPRVPRHRRACHSSSDATRSSLGTPGKESETPCHPCPPTGADAKGRWVPGKTARGRGRWREKSAIIPPVGTKRKNPFTPGAGKSPPHRTGHGDAAHGLFGMADCIGRRKPAGGAILCGPPGAGKTSLLAEMRERAEKRKVRVIELDTRRMTGNPDEKLGRMLAPWRWKPLLTFRGLVSMLPGGGGTGLGSGHIETSPAGVVLRLLLKDPLLVIVDEAHEMPPDFAGALLRAAKRCVRSGLPLLVVLAGTPGLQAVLDRSRAGFWVLSARMEVGRLETRDDIRAALSVPAERSGLPFADDALDLLVEESQGYPSLIQLVGKWAWEATVARDPNADRIRLEDAEACVPAARQGRGELYADRLREIGSRKILPEALAVSKAFAVLGGGDALSETELATALGPVLTRDRSVRDAIEGLFAVGLIWQTDDHSLWKQGIPSLCNHIAECPASKIR